MPQNSNAPTTRCSVLLCDLKGVSRYIKLDMLSPIASPESVAWCSVRGVISWAVHASIRSASSSSSGIKRHFWNLAMTPPACSSRLALTCMCWFSAPGPINLDLTGSDWCDLVFKCLRAAGIVSHLRNVTERAA